MQDPSARDVFNFAPMPYAAAVTQAIKRTQLGDVEAIWAGAQADLTPGVTLSTTEGMIVEWRSVTTSAAPSALFTVFSEIGGRRGWLYANWAWRLRGLLDRLLGGVVCGVDGGTRTSCARATPSTSGVWKPSSPVT